MKGGAILFSEMTPEPSFEADFHDWYDTEHIPIRMGAPGFASAQRYRAHSGGGYLAVYEMSDLSALDSPAYRVIKSEPSERTRFMLKNVRGFTRYLGKETYCRARDGNTDAALDSSVLYAVWFNVPADRAKDFNDWYEQDHIPILLKCPDWRMVRRFDITDGEPETWTHLALHYLNDAAALESPERAEARQTPWRDRLAAEPWFKGKYTMFDRHRERQIACPQD
jgi:hypothetical protein